MLGKERSDKDYRYVARRVGKYISELPDWEHMGASKHASKLYGVQKAFKRVTKLEEEGDL